MNEYNLKEELSGIGYSDIFGSLDNQISAIKVEKKILKLWIVKLEAAKLYLGDTRRTCQWDRVIHVQIFIVLPMIVLLMYTELDDIIYGKHSP